MSAIPPRWRHQEEAYQFMRSLWSRKQNGGMLAMVMGCVAGDAEIIVNRRGNARRYKLRDLHYKFHGGETVFQNQVHCWNPDIPSQTRSLIEGELHLNQILDVISRGVQPVLRITLASGKSIQVTADHEIAIPGGWIAASHLTPKQEILTNGQVICRECQSTISNRYGRHTGLCRSCAQVNRYKEHRKEKIIDKDGYVRLYHMPEHPRHNAAGQVYEHIVVMEKILGRSITRDEHVHHKDRVRHHNDPSNLEVLPGPGHSWRHGKEGGYLRLNTSSKTCFVPRIDTVISVEPDGKTDVYDLIMVDPGHNFVANGVIVHNCGKSRVAVELARDNGAEQLLVLSPLRVVEVWDQQFARFAPGHFHVVALDERAGSVQEKYQKARELYQWSEERHHPIAICINYDSARLSPFGDWAANQMWDMVIADEIHRCKEVRGRTSMWLAKVGRMAQRRLGLTGTPMPHTPLDIWAQFRFLNPFHLDPSYGQFKSRYAIMGGYYNKEIVGWQNLDELEARFRQLAFRVDESVLDLPDTMDEVRTADMGKEGTRIYDQMERQMIADIEGGVVTASNALVRLLRLAQITGGTVTDEDGNRQQIDTAKEDLLTELLEDLTEPVVVFCRFRADLEAVHRAAQAAELGSLELSGERDELTRWQQQAGPPFVLAVQIQAGGVGVDLTRARIAIYFSLDFSLANYLQSRARIHRPPQSRPVVFYHLEIRHSIDEYIMHAIRARHDLVESVLQELKTKGAKDVVTGGNARVSGGPALHRTDA